jgi:hypothetical protein
MRLGHETEFPFDDEPQPNKGDMQSLNFKTPSKQPAFILI